jgi:hypothetical protein
MKLEKLNKMKEDTKPREETERYKKEARKLEFGPFYATMRD